MDPSLPMNNSILVSMFSAGEEPVKNVVVVGAGPVGLLTALRLAQAGIEVDVLEKDTQLSQEPRAAGYFGGSLLALERAGVLDQVRKDGFTGMGLCWRKPLVDDGKGEKRLGEVIARLPSPARKSSFDDITGIIHLRQAELTKLLYKMAIKTGLVTVHFGTQLTGIQDSDDFVTAIVTKINSDLDERLRGLILIGADGGKSATRKLLGIPFKGHSWPERVVAIDLLFEDPKLDNAFPTSAIVHPINFGIFTPLERPRSGEKILYRCSVAVDPADKRSDEELTSEAYISDVLDKMLPGPRPTTAEVLRSSPYKVHQLCASTFRRGRCVLVGDAAHLNNPWGAMGLTTGLLDSEALADTLELIILEHKPLTLLDVYSDERQRVFQTFVDPVSAQNRLRIASDPETATEDWFFRAMINSSPEMLAEFGKPFFDVWRTDMRKVVQAKISA